MKLACQEHLIPGDDLGKKWQVAQTLGFDGIELRGHGDFAFQKRLPELKKAQREGAVFPSVCVIMSHFIADFDQEKRLDALNNMKSLLSIIAELGGSGAITPASYGMHSNSLPPYRAPRTPKEDEEILLEALHSLGSTLSVKGYSCSWSLSTAMRTIWSIRLTRPVCCARKCRMNRFVSWQICFT